MLFAANLALMRRRLGLVLAAVVTAAVVTSMVPARAVSPIPIDCVGPAGDPAPGSLAWKQRDAANQYCATERLQDEHANPGGHERKPACVARESQTEKNATNDLTPKAMRWKA